MKGHYARNAKSSCPGTAICRFCGRHFERRQTLLRWEDSNLRFSITDARLISPRDFADFNGNGEGPDHRIDPDGEVRVLRPDRSLTPNR
jgi:hypothetical protein